MVMIGVVGTRTCADYAFVKSHLDQHLKLGDTIITGGAQGVDSLAERYANEHGYTLKIIKPDWSLDRKGGPIRNTEIVKSSQVIIAFWDGVSKGTQDTITKGNKMGRRVIVIPI